MVSWPNSDGIGPVNALWERINSHRLVSWPNSDGIGPVNALSESRKYSGWSVGPTRMESPRSTRCRRAATYSRLVSWPNSDGIGPDNSLPKRPNVLQVGQLAQINALRERYNRCRLVSWPNSDGIGPDQRVGGEPQRPAGWSVGPTRMESARSTRCRRATTYFRLVSWPNSDGIGPVNALSESHNDCRLVSWPNSDGIGPDNSLRESHNGPGWSVGPTRAGSGRSTRCPGEVNLVTAESSTSMPSHRVMGVSTLQGRSASPANRSRRARSTSQSATRPGWSSGSGTTVPLAH